MQGILLFSHGSLLCGASKALDEHADRLRTRFAPIPVEIGFLNYSEPSFERGVQRLAELGATEIVIVPYFLVAGYFVSHSLPEVLVPVRAQFPTIEFTIAEALGADEHLADGLIEAARSASPRPEVWRDVYADAAASCLDRADCPIYGTPSCPATAAMADTRIGASDAVA
jgi:sirohydrochlorin ferrochelatase